VKQTKELGLKRVRVRHDRPPSTSSEGGGTRGKRHHHRRHWTPKATRRRRLQRRHVARFKEMPDYLDTIEAYISCQILQQGAKVAGLEQGQLRDTFARRDSRP